jgi:hypothetical protein
MYSSWYTTSYGCTSFAMLVWSYHRWFVYPFAMLSMWGWTHYNPWYISRYHCNYWIGEWSSCIERGFPHFPLPYMEMNRYCHHQRWFLDLGECCHRWFNLYRFGVACFDDDNTWNNSCCSKQGTILHRVITRKWFHSLCHRDLWLFPSLFWFFCYFLCTCQYSSPSTYLLGTFDCLYLIINNNCW